MRIWKKLTSKKAISPLIATLVLLGITAAAGIAIYGMVFSNIGVLSSSVSVQVVSIDLIQVGDMKMFSVSVKNTGNRPITSCTITVYGDSDTSAFLEVGAMDPGQTASATKTGSELTALTVTAGRTYPVKVEAATADGSTFSRGMTVVCSD